MTSFLTVFAFASSVAFACEVVRAVRNFRSWDDIGHVAAAVGACSLWGLIATGSLVPA